MKKYFRQFLNMNFLKITQIPKFQSFEFSTASTQNKINMDLIKILRQETSKN